MAERMTHEEYVAIQRRFVADIARKILIGEEDVLPVGKEALNWSDEALAFSGAHDPVCGTTPCHL